MVPVTVKLIAAGRSTRGGWTRAQLALLGVPWPPSPGWQNAALGRLIPRLDAERFVASRAVDETGRSLFEPPYDLP